MNMQEKAFPNPHLTGETGMTMRDYFAAKAMQIFIQWHQQKVIFEEFKYEESTHCWSDEDVASKAYEMADAMMEARK
jgi:hypothetical protein